MKYLKVKNWDNFQHYKDRNPPWIKLSTDTFQDYEFSRLKDASKLLAICIWTLASRYKDPKEGLVPADIEYIKNQCGLGKDVTIDNLKELVTQGFIIDASDMLADRKQLAIPETERETETKTEAETELNTYFENFWNAFPKNNRSKGSRKDAENKFKIALTKDTFENIMEGVRKYETYIRNTGQSNKDAFRWLEKECWRDDYAIQSYELPRKATADDNITAGAYAALLELTERQGY